MNKQQTIIALIISFVVGVFMQYVYTDISAMSVKKEIEPMEFTLPSDTPTPTLIPTRVPMYYPSTNENYYDYPSAVCEDGTYSYSLNRQGTCSHHGGVSIWM